VASFDPSVEPRCDRRGVEGGTPVTDDDELHHALLAIHSRLGLIEGKINLVARAERQQILTVIEEAFGKDPLLAQIYLLLDGKRTQREIVAELEGHGITCSQPTVSRRMTDLVTEYGIAEPRDAGAATVLGKNRASEEILNLSRRARRWLESDEEIVPTEPVKRRRR
jgi:hypothetical protein